VTMLDHSDSQPRWNLSDDAGPTHAQDPPMPEQTQAPDSRGQCFLFCPSVAWEQLCRLSIAPDAAHAVVSPAGTDYLGTRRSRFTQP